jgi:hypothetical protein
MGDDKEKHIGTLCSEDNGSLVEELERDIDRSPDPVIAEMTDPCMMAMNSDSAKIFREKYPERLKAWGQIYSFSMDYLGSIGVAPEDAVTVYNMAKEKLGLPKKITPRCRNKTHNRDEAIKTLNECCVILLGQKKTY